MDTCSPDTAVALIVKVAPAVIVLPLTATVLQMQYELLACMKHITPSAPLDIDTDILFAVEYPMLSSVPAVRVLPLMLSVLQYTVHVPDNFV
jgi:hypothetical protein